MATCSKALLTDQHPYYLRSSSLLWRKCCELFQLVCEPRTSISPIELDSSGKERLTQLNFGNHARLWCQVEAYSKIQTSAFTSANLIQKSPSYCVIGIKNATCLARKHQRHQTSHNSFVRNLPCWTLSRNHTRMFPKLFVLDPNHEKKRRFKPCKGGKTVQSAFLVGNPKR